MNELHRRWVKVVESKAGEDLTGWVGVSDATLDDFARGVVHGRQVAADERCTPDCPSCRL